MLRSEKIQLTAIDEKNPVFQQLFEIFRLTLNREMTYKEFKVYYFYHLPHFIDITFLKDGEEIVGFISACFFKHCFAGKDYTVCRGAIGMLEKYRRGSLTGWQLCLKYIAYKCRHPFENIYLTAFITNPVMYSMICKYSGTVYPRRNHSVPAKIVQLKDDLFQLYRLQKKELRPFVVKLHFHVPHTAAELERIYASKDRDLLHYLSLNKKFTEREGLFMIVPVSWSNVSVSLVKAMLVRPLVKACRKNANLLSQEWRRLKPQKHYL